MMYARKQLENHFAKSIINLTNPTWETIHRSFVLNYNAYILDEKHDKDRLRADWKSELNNMKIRITTQPGISKLGTKQTVLERKGFTPAEVQGCQTHAPLASWAKSLAPQPREPSQLQFEGN